MRNPAKLLKQLKLLEFGHGRVKGKLFKDQYTLGKTCGLPRSAGFDQDGFNSDIVPKYLTGKEQAVLLELWTLLKA